MTVHCPSIIRLFSSILLNFKNACLSSAVNTADKSPHKENSFYIHLRDCGQYEIQRHTGDGNCRICYFSVTSELKKQSMLSSVDSDEYLSSSASALEGLLKQLA